MWGAPGNRRPYRDNEEDQGKVRDKLLWLGIAPAEPLERRFAKDSANIYSEVDYITGPMGWQFNMRQKKLPQEEQIYNIQFLPRISKWSEMTGYITDHGIMGGTYQKGSNYQVKNWEGIYGFYKETR